MKKDVHIYVEEELAEQIEDYARREKQSISSSYQDLIRKGFIYHNIDFNFTKMNEDLSKVFVQLKYIKQLEKQIYADLNLEMESIEHSENLHKFEQRYFRNTVRYKIDN